MRIITHNGHFHTDELLAVAALLLKFPDTEVVRTRDEAIIKSADIAVDVGQVYNPKIFRFDHHQSEGAGKRDNGIPYASFGLVWKEFGTELAGGEEEAKIIEEKLVAPVDAGDNGLNFYKPLFGEIHEYSLGDYCESFAAGVESIEDYDRVFFEVLPIARGLLEREINMARRTVSDRREIREIYEKSENKKIITLPKYLHWKTALIPTEALFVVYPRPEGKWGTQAVPKSLNSFENKKNFPAAWAGLSGSELADVSGVADTIFCHKEKFLCVAMSREGALKLAEIALGS